MATRVIPDGARVTVDVTACVVHILPPSEGD
jgi:hypothetical protein